MELFKHGLVYFLLISLILTPCWAMPLGTKQEALMEVRLTGMIHEEDGVYDRDYSFTITVHTHYDMLGRLEWVKISKDENYEECFDPRRYHVFGTFSGETGQIFLTDFCSIVDSGLESDYISLWDEAATRISPTLYQWKKNRREQWQKSIYGLLRVPVMCMA